jgi:hypothetical protein
MFFCPKTFCPKTFCPKTFCPKNSEDHHLELVPDLGVLVDLGVVADHRVQLGHDVSVPAQVRVELHLEKIPENEYKASVIISEILSPKVYIVEIIVNLDSKY